MQLRHAFVTLLLATIALDVGCAGRGTGGTPKSTPPPGFPVAQRVGLKPGLQDRAEQELTNALKSSDAERRAHALEGVREAGDRRHADDVVRLLSDPEPVVRFAAAMAAGELGVEAAKPRLEQMASDPDTKVQVAVRFALHKLGDPRLSQDLENTGFGPIAPR